MSPSRAAPFVIGTGGRASLIGGILAVVLAVPLQAQPVGTAFTYQGRLTDAGNPPSGPYDLEIALFDASSAGAQVGTTLTRDNVTVTNGLFTASLDFGAVFSGSKRWLELRVRPGASTGAYTTLTPRQELAPAPNAVFSAAVPWTGVTGKPAGFADDTDDDALGALACTTGQIAKRTGSVWACADDPPAWGLTGNAGTSPAVNFIGTTDNQPFELKANNKRVLRVEPRLLTGFTGPNVLLGYEGNTMAPGVQGSTVAGGGLFNAQDWSNRVTGNFAVVSGGVRNRAGGPDGSTPLDFTFATVGGGESNNASGFAAATIGGGRLNVASAGYTTIAGGESNVASGNWAMVLGGLANTAGGQASFAGGSGGRVRNATESGDSDGDEGTFLWAGHAFGAFTSTGPNQFLVRAPGGFGINTTAPVPGGLTLAAPGKLTFGAQTRQMIDLWGSGQYGIGVQGGTVYFRTEPPGGGYAWFLGGTHNDTQNDPGAGGIRQMRLDGAGNLFVRGSVNPGGADFAEMLPAEPGLEAGDVLAIGADGRLALSTKPYEDTLAGVYSTKPGLVGGAADGESLEGKVPLAMSGVVPVKVTDEGGPIVAGDALTSSSTPGHAMKASKIRVGGVAFFPSGVVLGKALEPLQSASGVIRALVVLQ